MKKRTLALLIVTALAVILVMSVIACESIIDYNVTVLSPDEKPLANVTVNFKMGDRTAGSAKTDEDGNVILSLPAGTYTVELENYGEGFAYTPLSLGSQLPETTITLSVKKINYTVNVKDKAGAPAKDVNVTFTSGNKIAGTAKTDANGNAQTELDYGEYTVTLSNLPDGNLAGGNKKVTGQNPVAEFNLVEGDTVTYKVTVKSEGGLIFKNAEVLIFQGDDFDLIASGNTDENGEYRFAYEAGSFTAMVENVPNGYSTAEASLSANSTEALIELHSEIIKTEPDADTTYVLGDIFHDYSFTTPYNMADGKPWSKSIAQILEEKDAIIINNWGLNCSWCVTEMPDMQELYEAYFDQIEIIAVNNFISQGQRDTDGDIKNYQAQKGYTFPMMRDTYNFITKFGISGWPYTIIIDRYGAVARIEAGAVIGYEAWERMITRYIGEDYVQTFIPGDKVSDSINNEVAKPDVEVPEDHYTTKVPGALHNTAEFPQGSSITWRGETENEYVWPFMIGNDANVSPDGEYLYASNIHKPNTMSAIYANVNVIAGKVLTFDYYADTEEGDKLFFVLNGRIIHQINGNSKGWKTCYLYTGLTDDEYNLGIAYLKDVSGDTDTDNVYIRNIRFVDVTALNNVDQSVNILRQAAYGTPEEGDARFPYYAEVYVGEDGFYRVRRDSLQNSSFAGNDEDPLLLANIANVTSWSPNYSLSELVVGVNEQGEYAYSCVFTINGVRRDYRKDLVRYLSAANGSDIEDRIPVNQFFHDMLVAFMANVSGSKTHKDEWLEICDFYSHYGAGNPVGNPIVGMMPETAITLSAEERYTVSLTRNMYPFPTTIYAFTPEVDGLYKFESFIADADRHKLMAQIWVYDDNSDAGEPLFYSGESRISLTGTNEQNFVIYHRLEAGHKYYVELALMMNERGSYEFSVTRQTEDVTVLLPASLDVFDMVLDENGEMTEEIELAGAVEYVKDEDGYFKTKDGEYIYLDVLNANTTALGTIPLVRLVNKFVQDPLIGEDGKVKDLDYKFFDFRYCVMYVTITDDNGNKIDTYSPKVDITEESAKYKDYTDIMLEYINSAPKDGEYKGLIKVDQQLVDILSMFIELRVNGVWIEEMNNNTITKWAVDPARENEWLRFCWYFHTYKAEVTEAEAE